MNPYSIPDSIIDKAVAKQRRTVIEDPMKKLDFKMFPGKPGLGKRGPKVPGEPTARRNKALGFQSPEDYRVSLEEIRCQAVVRALDSIFGETATLGPASNKWTVEELYAHEAARVVWYSDEEGD